MPDPVTINAGPFLVYVFFGLNFPILYAAGMFNDANTDTLSDRGQVVFGYVLGGGFLASVQTFLCLFVFEVVDNGWVAVVFISVLTFGAVALWVRREERQTKLREQERREEMDRQDF